MFVEVTKNDESNRWIVNFHMTEEECIENGIPVNEWNNNDTDTLIEESNFIGVLSKTMCACVKIKGLEMAHDTFSVDCEFETEGKEHEENSVVVVNCNFPTEIDVETFLELFVQFQDDYLNSLSNNDGVNLHELMENGREEISDPTCSNNHNCSDCDYAKMCVTFQKEHEAPNAHRLAKCLTISALYTFLQATPRELCALLNVYKYNDCYYVILYVTEEGTNIVKKFAFYRDFSYLKSEFSEYDNGQDFDLIIERGTYIGKAIDIVDPDNVL